MGPKSLIVYLGMTAVGFGALASDRGPLRPMLDECRALSTTIELNQLSTAMLLEDGMDARAVPPPAEFPRVLERRMQTPRLAAADGWGRPYLYRSAGRGFEIRSMGPDGKLGGGDDLTTEWGMDADGASPWGPGDAELRRFQWGSSAGIRARPRASIAAMMGVPTEPPDPTDAPDARGWRQKLWDRLVKPPRPFKRGETKLTTANSPAPRQAQPAANQVAPIKPVPGWVWR